MQPSAAAQPSPASRTFAGVLMDMAAPEVKRPPARDLDGLEDDVATLSYEEALRVHARYRAPAAEGRPQLIANAASEQPSPNAGSMTVRKSDSVTVRLSHAESEQLRQRAAESGLTISDYLRSCVFEVESLRAQVKKTVAELRALQVEKSEAPRGWWRRWLAGRRSS